MSQPITIEDIYRLFEKTNEQLQQIKPSGETVDIINNTEFKAKFG